ncbi:TPA: hypothetical protein ACH3X2_013418 [Trebouxia sp. C0005]
MEVEIKLRLPNKEAHDKVAEALKDSYIETHDQENFFYEGSEKELNKAKVSLRTRFYGVDKKCVITMKGRQSMVGGVGTATEVEEDCNPAEARKWLKDPDALLNLRGSNILEKLRTELKPKHLVCLGGSRMYGKTTIMRASRWSLMRPATSGELAMRLRLKLRILSQQKPSWRSFSKVKESLTSMAPRQSLPTSVSRRLSEMVMPFARTCQN